MDLPLFLAWRVRDLFAFDHERGQWWCAGEDDAELTRDSAEGAESAGAVFANGSPVHDAVGFEGRADSATDHDQSGFQLGFPWIESPDRACYMRMVERAREYIAAGDIFQVNLARWFTTGFSGDPFAYFRALCRRNPSPYAVYAEWPADGHGLTKTAVASCSPELLVNVRGDRVETRPIAGTYPRTEARAELSRDPKERAEHVMLVDLERNDLGRLAVPGTVKVEEMLGIEEYSHLYHIVSQVAARLRPGTTSRELLRALFPGGTITGAPKVRAMEIIAELEPYARGLYTGGVGWMDDGGDLSLNIAIRTAVIQAGEIRIAAGAGIVADSRSEREADESAVKAAALLDPEG